MRRGRSTPLKKKFSGGHPWRTADVLPRATKWPNRASLISFDGSWWFYSPESYLRLRRLGPPQKGWFANKKIQGLSNADQFQVLFGDWLHEHMVETLQKKMVALGLAANERCLRWLFSENDLIPGLIVDVFGTTLSVQLNSAPIELFWPTLRSHLVAAYQHCFQVAPQIIELRNAPIRKKEGLDIIEPEPLHEQTLYWNQFYWQMTPGSQQKTGAYFDQRVNHLRVAELASQKKYKTAWDLCCYQGGFALHLIAKGLNVVALDQSALALETARANVLQNNLNPQLFRTECADVFQWLKTQARQPADPPDLIILDPPSFVKSRQELASALRGFLELNTLALQCLKPGGTLVSCVCSHHVSPKDYEKILKEAGQSAKCSIDALENFGPSPDHLPALDFPEGRYLQVWTMIKSA